MNAPHSAPTIPAPPPDAPPAHSLSSRLVALERVAEAARMAAKCGGACDACARAIGIAIAALDEVQP